MTNRLSCVAFAVLATFLGPTEAFAVRPFEIIQHFPADRPADQAQTQWRIVWGIERHAGQSEVLVIREAHFKRGPKEEEIKVLADCRLAEIFVPYSGGGRVYDISAQKFSMVNLDRKALGPACVTAGSLYDRSGVEQKAGPLVKEVHDGHVRWMDGRNRLRRGQVLDLWSVLNAANYRYIMRYQFRDDGAISVRLGATAHNLNKGKDDKTTHVHVGFWRMHIDLGGERTSVSLAEFVNLGLGLPRTVVTELQTEKRIIWKPERFTRLRVESLVFKNKHNPPSFIGYEFHPVRMGTAAFHGVGEEFTRADFWITRYRPLELRPRDLPRYANEEKLEGKFTIWHSAPVLHVARDEDFGPVDHKPGQGVALTAWAGFDLKPRNFFASTPLFP